ncbi:MAG: circularly permuted type 2 ATP-grasp protein, partial [Bacteroidota bacterium]|nr:circularly permuted type 2 ATP-grasp protein [Bacteroidota bacterium]
MVIFPNPRLGVNNFKYKQDALEPRYTSHALTSNTWDEMFDKDNQLRSVYGEFGSYLSRASLDELNKMQEFSSEFFMNQGVTFTVYNNKKGVERIFPFDIIPRIIAFKEWKKIELGIVQRIKALNFFLKDIYNEQFIIKDKIIKPNLVISNPNYLREMKNLKVPQDIYTHISGVDLIRNNDGKFYVLEDNLRTPSGVSYMLENREITRRLYPDILPKQKILQVNNYPQILYQKLKTLSTKTNPEIVLLTPGLYNSAYYEHT